MVSGISISENEIVVSFIGFLSSETVWDESMEKVKETKNVKYLIFIEKISFNYKGILANNINSRAE
jgi:hypothetical protein